jgi:type IV pilus assembly protein PilB
LELSAEQLRGKKFYRGSGCENCNNTGYKGRVGLFELMIMNNEIREMIMQNASTDEIRSVAQKGGMLTLRDAGMKVAFEGITTPEEVVRETIVEG